MNQHFDQALRQQQSGNLREAAASYERGLSLEPHNADACHMAGVVALELNDLPKAVDLLSRAVSLNSASDAAWTNLGAALRKSRQWEPALAAFEHATAINPARAEAHLLAGHVKLTTERFAEAEQAFSQALQARPGWADAFEGKGYALRQMHRLDEALQCAFEAVAADPTRGAAHRLAGDLLQNHSRFEDAERHYRRALEIDPNDFPAHLNLGLLLGKRDRTGDGLVHLRRAYALHPSNANIGHSLAMALLKTGHFAEGWELFRWRHQLPAAASAHRPFAAALLETIEIRGKQLFLWTEQGVGDEILFAGLISDLVRCGARLTLECETRLVPLFARSFPDIEIIARNDPPHPRFAGPFDAHIGLADTARWLRPTFESFPRHAGYLRPDRALTAALRNAYRESQPDGPLLVGISWRTTGGVKWTRQKSLELSAWAPLLRMPGITFVNLQYGNHTDEVEAAGKQHDAAIITDPTIDPLSNLDAFAAQVAALDAVVTTSNTTAHVAGALNIPTWTLIPSGDGGLWHWFTERDDSPWYPSMHLIRQRGAGDWNGMLESAAKAVATHSVAHRKS